MSCLKKECIRRRRIRKLLVGSIILELFLFPQISSAGADVSNLSAAPSIIVQDPESGAVVLRRNGAYYCGFFKGKNIINLAQIAPGELIVKYKKQNGRLTLGGRNPVATVAGRFAAETKTLNHDLGLTLVRLSKEKEYFKTLQALAKNPNVAYVEPNYIVKAQFIPDDPYYPKQWGLPAIKAESAWDKIDPAKRAEITIAVLDTGVNAAQEDLKDNIVPGYDFVNNDADTTDVLGHGTHIAGIAAALVNNGLGIAGVAGGAKIMPVKVLDDTGNGSDSNIIAGIKYAVDHGAQIINMSLGGPDPSNAMQDAINYATSHGVNVVAAAGNEDGPVDMPANCQNVIAVGAIENNGRRASYSNAGPELDVVAPGSDIYSTYIGSSSNYASLNGTSMAAPFVTGVVALIKAANPDLSPSEVTDIVRQSATDLGAPGFDNDYGYGLVNADKAVDLALRETEKPAPSLSPNPNPPSGPAPAPSPQPAPGIVNLAVQKTAPRA